MCNENKNSAPSSLDSKKSLEKSQTFQSIDTKNWYAKEPFNFFKTPKGYVQGSGNQNKAGCNSNKSQASQSNQPSLQRSLTSNLSSDWFAKVPNNFVKTQKGYVQCSGQCPQRDICKTNGTKQESTQKCQLCGAPQNPQANSFTGSTLSRNQSFKSGIGSSILSNLQKPAKSACAPSPIAKKQSLGSGVSSSRTIEQQKQILSDSINLSSATSSLVSSSSLQKPTLPLAPAGLGSSITIEKQKPTLSKSKCDPNQQSSAASSLSINQSINLSSAPLAVSSSLQKPTLLQSTAAFAEKTESSDCLGSLNSVKSATFLQASARNQLLGSSCAVQQPALSTSAGPSSTLIKKRSFASPNLNLGNASSILTSKASSRVVQQTNASLTTNAQASNLEPSQSTSNISISNLSELNYTNAQKNLSSILENNNNAPQPSLLQRRTIKPPNCESILAKSKSKEKENLQSNVEPVCSDKKLDAKPPKAPKQVKKSITEPKLQGLKHSDTVSELLSASDNNDTFETFELSKVILVC